MNRTSIEKIAETVHEKLANSRVKNANNIHINYRTIENVTLKEFQILHRVDKNIKFWRMSDIIAGLEPRNARWGHIHVPNDMAKQHAISSLTKMSRVVSRLTWIVYVSPLEDEVMIKAGKLFTRS